jgi:hypothetical protein
MRYSRTSAEDRNTSGITEKSQQLIVCPTRVNRSSPKISELRDSLAGYGVDSVFEDPEHIPVSQLIPYDYEDTREQIVRSTIFWEASVLSLGSELLLTMRRAGWRPAYSRISGKYTVLKCKASVLMMCRERPNSLPRKPTNTYLLFQSRLQTAVFAFNSSVV